MGNIYAEELSDSNLIVVIGKISIFQEIAKNFTYLLYQFQKAMAWEEYSFSILPVVSR